MVTWWSVTTEWEPAKTLMPLGVLMSAFLLVELKSVFQNLLHGFTQWRSGWVAVWLTERALHLGFAKRDIVPLCDIKELGYAYLRNGKESAASIDRKTGARKLLIGTDYDAPLHEILTRIADRAGLERQSDVEYRDAGRWTAVTWGAPFESEWLVFSVLEGFERP